MIVYVESNFVLEIALQQGEVESARAILELGEAGNIELAIPAFSLSEPFWTVMHKGNERKKLCNTLEEQLRELGRSASYQGLASDFESMPETLLGIEWQEMKGLESIVYRLLEAGRQIMTTPESFLAALVSELDYGLSPQDSIVYSAVTSDLLSQPSDSRKCFLSRNSRDFNNPDIIAQLEKHNCKYLPRFESGLAYITSQTSS